MRISDWSSDVCSSDLCSSASSSARLLQRRGDRLDIHVDDLQVGFQHALAAVLEGDLGLDVGRADSGVERLDQRPIALRDKAAAHLPGACQLTVVGVQLLVQHQEAANLAGRELRVGGQIAEIGRESGRERAWQYV